MTGDALVEEAEGAEFAGDAFFLLAFDGSAIGKVLAFGEFGNPAKSGFDGRGGVVQIVAVETEAGFEAERVARTESDWFDAFATTCFKEGVPNSKGMSGRKVKLEASGTRIACVG
ncbi:hypothetical protein Barb7_03224 [Bacteroidales bacterium Barb7]|nr:hypothetical protein Barb7_03224 [Bacteroidales bacterium Barb7]